MNPEIINGIISACLGFTGAVIGGGIGAAVTLTLRKEKFKKIVYEERLAAYKKILGHVIKIFFFINVVAKVFDSAKSATQLKKLTDEVFGLFFSLETARMLVSKDVSEKADEIIKFLPVAFKKPEPENSIQVGKDAVFAANLIKDLVNAIRSDLGTDALSYSIDKTIKGLGIFIQNDRYDNRPADK